MSLNLFQNPMDWINFHSKEIKNKQSLGFVPTMGALHEGHLSLVKRAKAENNKVLVSIFINPTQFNDPKDLKAYPSHLENDIELLKSCGTDFVLAPTAQEMYPDQFQYRVHETTLSPLLCGRYRPGHFEGMLTVVLKLLNIAQADRAYFGEKDFQQLELVRGLVGAFFIPTEIIGCPTIRSDGGLALSSRNKRLTKEELEKALLFPKILKQNLDLTSLKNSLENEGFKVDYVEEWRGRRLAAVHLGNVRLIDNVALSEVRNTYAGSKEKGEEL